MCEFISWIEYETQILFLTDADLNTKKGKELTNYLGDKFLEDIKGHGAIRFYYEIGDKRGHNKECTDFSSPDNFPSIIQAAIKKGKFSKIGKPVDIKQLLTSPALAEYNKIKDTAWAEYHKIEGPAWAEYNKIEDTALAEYHKIEGPAFWKVARVRINRVECWQ